MLQQQLQVSVTTVANAAAAAPAIVAAATAAVNVVWFVNSLAFAFVLQNCCFVQNYLLPHLTSLSHRFRLVLLKMKELSQDC
jgi:hypothetical protein